MFCWDCGRVVRRRVYDAHMDIAQAMKEAATPALVEELNLRGYHVMWKQPETPTASASVSEETDLDRWLEVWRGLEDANQEGDANRATSQTVLALIQLVELLQPPSVRVARQVTADGEASSQT